MTPWPRRHLDDPGPQSGTQSTFRTPSPRLSRNALRSQLGRHWPAAVAGAVGAGALVLAVVVSGGAGAQPGPEQQGVRAADIPSAAAPVPTPPIGTPPAAVTPAAESAPTADPAEQSPGKVESTDKERSTDKQVKSAKITIPEQGPDRFVRSRLDGPKVGDRGAPLLRYAVKVEENLPYDAAETAEEIQATLSDRRSWTGGGRWRLELVSDPGKADFTIYLATPGTVDRHCWPLRTYGRVSCQAGNRVMLNAWRWAHGAEAYGKDVAAYRHYLVNHEVGHRLGHRHLGCPGKGKRAPVMMQQTKGVDSCEANPWPAPKRDG